MKNSAEYRGIARDNLKDNWGTAVGVCLIAALISVLAGIIPVAGVIISLLVAGPLVVAQLIYFIKLHNRENPKVSDMFEKVGDNFIANFYTYLLQNIFMVLWFFVFIVPGIVKRFAYSMTMFIRTKQPNIGATESITLSRKMMDGHKWQLACLEFSFIGWILLSFLTLGIGFIFLAPYMNATQVAFFEDVYSEYQSKINQTSEEIVAQSTEDVKQ